MPALAAAAGQIRAEAATSRGAAGAPRAWRAHALTGAVMALVAMALALPATAPAQLSFTAPTDHAVGDFPRSTAVGDFDGDSDPDLAVANQGSNNVSVLLGEAGAGFAAATYFAVGNSPASVVVGHFNGDSDPDLAVANGVSHNVSVLLGDGDGSFGSATNFSAGAGSFPGAVAVGDFDGDTDFDLAVANSGTDDVSVLLGDGQGGFSGPTKFGAGDYPNALAVGDFDGDSDSDLAVANVVSSDVSVLLGDGNGGFDPAPTPTVAAVAAPVSVAVGEFNSDSDPDLAVANASSQSGDISVLLGTRKGARDTSAAPRAASFLHRRRYSLYGGPAWRPSAVAARQTAGSPTDERRLRRTYRDRVCAQVRPFRAGPGSVCGRWAESKAASSPLVSAEARRVSRRVKTDPPPPVES